MHSSIVRCGDGFWNIRGSFKLAGLVELGTHCSLVRLGDGRFVILDSYSLPDAVMVDVDQITGGRENVVAVINTHPFHTLHSEAMRSLYPGALHYGTRRHIRNFGHLEWAVRPTETLVSENPFAADLDFSVPAGVELIPANENIHCGSVLAYHPASATIHVDDTFNLRKGKLSVHPTLRFALKREAGAADGFRAWGREIVQLWAGAQNLCAAHDGVLNAGRLGTQSVAQAIEKAMERAEKRLRKHERAYG